MLLAALLSLLIGALLGLLGGGGGILAVPMLVYVVGVEVKTAIATSLFFIGATSAVGAALAAREGRVRWATGALFGGGSMAGAFLGGRLARFVPERALLLGLGAVMLATAVAMVRGRPSPVGGPRPSAAGPVLALGGAVGVVSGLVGAGGGFLIVPALTLLRGLALRDAIGTSLFIIAVQSFAGVLGHLGHAELSMGLVATLTVTAMLGMAGGRALGGRLPAPALTRGFAALVLVTGLFLLGRPLLPAWLAASRILGTRMHSFTPYSALAGGAVIGLAASLFLLVHGRVCGVSGLFAGLFRPNVEVRAVRLTFVGGLVVGGLGLRVLYPGAFASEVPSPLFLVVPAGLLVGFGTQLGGGCTSGHGVCGISRLSARSMVATVTFMATGFVTVFLLRHLLGGGR